MKKRTPAKTGAGRWFRLILPATLILVVGAMFGCGLLVYLIVAPGPTTEPIGPSDYRLPSMEATWLSADGTRIDGWWIQGRKGAPAVALVPGYGMNRSSVLSLAAALHDSGFHSLVYNQRGNGASPHGTSSLGLSETEDLATALDWIRERPEADREKLGVWGVDVGARAAMGAAAGRREVRALVLDSPFDPAADFLDLQVRKVLGCENSTVEFACRQGFCLWHRVLPKVLWERISSDALAGREALFITGENRVEAGRMASALAERLQPPPAMKRLSRSRTRIMNGRELDHYDRLVAKFFHQTLLETVAP